MIWKDGSMKSQDKGSTNIDQQVESKEGERGPLSCNKVNVRSPSLEFTPNTEFTSEDAALDYLASILVEVYLDYYSNANKQEDSSDLLSGINKRTSR